MKRQLNFLNVKLLRGIFAALLLVSISCTEYEDVENINEETLITNLDESADIDGLTHRKKDPKNIGQSCDNPLKSGTTYYRQYESTDVGAGTDVVSRTAINGTNVDVIKFLDDRTCSFNYSQSGSYGVYRLAANSNGFDGLQPRIERQSKKVDRGGSRFTSVEGYVNIRSVGSGDAVKSTSSATITNQKRFGEESGTYIMQAKGQHDNQTEGSPDPAILLLIAKPANPEPGTGRTRYNLYAEQIKRPGGSGSSGRELQFLRTILGNQDVFIKMVNRFSNTGNVQYVDIQIGKNPTLKNYTFRVPNGNGKKGKNAKIRFGAYRCKNGSANIRWRNIKHDYRI